MRRLIPVFLYFIFLGMVTVLSADAEENKENKTIEKATASEIFRGMARKTVRGIVNIPTGVGELPKQIYVTSSKDGAAPGATIGLFKGIYMTLFRTVVGGFEIATFFIPMNGIYEPLYDPEYVWQKEL